MAHLLSCRLLDEACTADDLVTVTERERHAPASGKTLCKGHERRKDKLTNGDHPSDVAQYIAALVCI